MNAKRKLLSLFFAHIAAAAVAGCPAHPQFIVADVASPRASPISGALVAAECSDHHSAAQTDDLGRARVLIHGDVSAERCMVVVASPGYQTLERRGANVCSSATACPPTTYRLEPTGGAR